MSGTTNASGVPEELLQCIERFVRKHCPKAESSALIIMREGDPFAVEERVITGDAGRYCGWRHGLPQKHVVRMCVPDIIFEKQYPDSFCTSEMDVEVLSWDEEFALVLAHEFRHIWQYETGNHSGKPQDPADELDAEIFAAKVLEQYRPWRNRYFIRTAARVAARKAA